MVSVSDWKRSQTHVGGTPRLPECEFSHMSKNGWGSDPLAVDAANAFASMEASLTVRLISTFEPNLVFCQEGDLVHKICECGRYQRFDYLPVKRDNRIVGLLSLKNMKSDFGADLVSQHMKRIDDTILISSDVGILSFVEHADEHPCRLVVSGMKLDGIVTLADLQKLPVRPSSIPSFYTTENIPLNDLHPDTVSAKRAMRGDSLCSGMVGINS